MIDKKKTESLFKHSYSKHHEPAQKPGETVKKGDPELEESIEEEIGEIDEVEKKACVNDPSKCSACDLEQQVVELRDELEESRNNLLRAHAEMQNIRNRAQSDVEKAHKYGLEKFVNELLPVVDSLEQALDSMVDKDIDAYMDGVQLTLTNILKVLEKVGVKQVNPIHEPFNPEYHEAISTQENPNVETNTILHVFRKGYVMNDRLVRPAMVVVSK